MRSFVTALALFAATAVGAEDLITFLNAATAATRSNVPVRAQGELVTTSPEGTVRDQLALVRRPNGDMYLELHNSGVRALVLADGKALIVAKKGGSPGHIKEIAFRQLVIADKIDSSGSAKEDAHGFGGAESDLFVGDVAHILIYPQIYTFPSFTFTGYVLIR